MCAINRVLSYASARFAPDMKRGYDGGTTMAQDSHEGSDITGKQPPAKRPSPLGERVVTDYASLPAGYVDHLQAKMDEEAARRGERHAS